MTKNAVLVPGSMPRSAQKQELYKLIVALSDVTAALEASKLMITAVTDFMDPLYYPLFSAIVVCYGRPFSQNKPFGRLKRNWETFADQRLQKTHKELVAMRNEVIAHSGLSVHKAQIVPPGAKIANLPWPNTGVTCQLHHRFYHLASFVDVRDTCMDLGERLQNQVSKEIEDLYGGMELPNVPFDLRFDEGL